MLFEKDIHSGYQGKGRDDAAVHTNKETKNPFELLKTYDAKSQHEMSEIRMMALRNLQCSQRPE